MSCPSRLACRHNRRAPQRPAHACRCRAARMSWPASHTTNSTAMPACRLRYLRRILRWTPPTASSPLPSSGTVRDRHACNLTASPRGSAASTETPSWTGPFSECMRAQKAAIQAGATIVGQPIYATRNPCCAQTLHAWHAVPDEPFRDPGCGGQVIRNATIYSGCVPANGTYMLAFQDFVTFLAGAAVLSACPSSRLTLPGADVVLCM